jgi:hypothetical protein
MAVGKEDEEILVTAAAPQLGTQFHLLCKSLSF